MSKPIDQNIEIAIVVCAYNMERELPRTIFSLGRDYQKIPSGQSYRLIVVDNGSARPVDEDRLREVAPEVSVVRYEPGNPSPARALNETIDRIDAGLIGLWIDGARLASPGIVNQAINAHLADPDSIVGTLGFHLGPDFQKRSVVTGYTREHEDRMLAASGWRTDGYNLFDMASYSESSRGGWLSPIAESNGVFFGRGFWRKTGGLDDRFESPGGGFLNLDFWSRAVQLSGAGPWIILGEGTFHQLHGGVATNGSDADRKLMAAEYARLLGHPYQLPDYQPRLCGNLTAKIAQKFPVYSAPAWRTVHSVFERSFQTSIPSVLLASIQQGSLYYRYKDIRCVKNPFDLSLYLKLLQTLRPRTIVEVGSLDGGSAVWLRDQCDATGLTDTAIVSIDRSPPDLTIRNVHFASGDATAPETSFPLDLLDQSPHPWLVIEDSAHTYDATLAVLGFFSSRLDSGDYIVVEDGVLAELDGPVYRSLEDGPNRAVARFLLDNPDTYQIDREYCDWYGYNVTWCPNGWLRRI